MATPHGQYISPRTRSGYSVVRSNTSTRRPPAASWAARPEPAIPPPTMTMSFPLSVMPTVHRRPAAGSTGDVDEGGGGPRVRAVVLAVDLPHLDADTLVGQRVADLEARPVRTVEQQGEA